jgi:multiple sugar transport system permease protein
MPAAGSTSANAGVPRVTSVGAGRKLKRPESVAGYLFIAPAMIGFLLFVLGPLLAVLAISLTKYDVLTAPEFVGVENYTRMLTDERLHTTFRNTIIYVIAAVVIMNALALLLAIALNRNLPQFVRNLLRSTYFFPSLVGLVYVSTIWQAMFQQDTGIINYYLDLVGGPRPDWLNGPQLSLVSVVIVDIWRNVGFGMLILLAALQDVPRELVDAAKVDGARPSKIARHVLIPLITPAIFFNVTMTLIGAFQIYESIIVLTGGGPGDNSRSIVMYLAEIGFQNFQMGYASAIAVVLLLFIVALTGLQFYLRRRWVHVG